MMKHYSPSQLNMFRKCAAQYYFRYVEGIKSPPTAALTLGGAVDTAITGTNPDKDKLAIVGDLSNKMAEGELCSEKDVDDLYLTAFDGRAEETAWWTKTERPETREQGRGLVRVAHKELCPNINPVAVQKSIEIAFENTDYTYLGYIDYLDNINGKVIPVDLKTSKARFSQDETDGDAQLTSYSLGLHDPKNNPYPSVRFDQLIKNKTPAIHQVCSERTQADYDLLLMSLSRMDYVIEHDLLQQVFQPPKRPFPCSPRWCGYWGICEGGKKF